MVLVECGCHCCTSFYFPLFFSTSSFWVHVRFAAAFRVVKGELELEQAQSHMAQKPMLRGDVGARVYVIRACGQRQEGRYGRARWCKAPR